MDDEVERLGVGAEMTAVILARHSDGITFLIESLSTGGARMLGPLTLDVGQLVRIILECDDRPIVKAKVVRVESRDAITARVVVRFVDLAGDARKSIRTLVMQDGLNWR